jgi:uncharacterized protein (UPF0210 family)
MSEAAALVITSLAAGTPGGAGNFNFAATFNTQPGIPYFPAGYAASPPSDGSTPPLTWAVGLENPDLVLAGVSKGLQQVAAASNAAAGESSTVDSNGKREAAPAAAWSAAASALQSTVQDALLLVQATIQNVEAATGVACSGIDASIAPAVEGPSLVEAYEALLGPGGFGGPGTLAVSRLITGALAAIRAAGLVRLVGYCGLMLPPLEDLGLAKAMASGRVTVPDIMMYSTVCGLGLDTVPIPGDSSVAAITLRIADLATLAYKLEKPLSCRLFPVPGKSPGDEVDFENPHMVKGAVVQL